MTDSMSGVLLLDKPEGLSSNAALQRVRRLLGARKAGHVGSLDPLATGMLPICLDEATKIAGDILSGRKRYRFTVALGSRTATGDREGPVVETLPVPTLDADVIEAALARFRGPQTQIPPMYSALKRDGQPLYRLARAGIEVERAARDLEIYELTCIGREVGRADVGVRESDFGATTGSDATVRDARGSNSPGVGAPAMRGEAPVHDVRHAGLLGADAAPTDLSATLVLDVLCSKGTYARVLAEDIAKALGTCGHVIQLRRVYVEPFENEPMLSLEALEAQIRAGERPKLIDPARALPQLPAVVLPEAAAARIILGQAVDLHDCGATGRVRVHDHRGRFLGIGEADGAGAVQPRRMFVQPLDSAASFSL